MSQQDNEITVFRTFLEYANLPVVLDTVEKRQPPEPDVLCRLSDNSQLAFELVEICHRRNAAFLGSAGAIYRLIEKEYQALSLKLREHFDSLFAGKPLSFNFHDEATINQIRNALPQIFVELARRTDKDGEYRPSSPSVSKVLLSVRFVGRSEEKGRPSFNIGGRFRPDDLVVQSISTKLGRHYKSAHPIELIAYLEHLRGLFPQRGKILFSRCLKIESSTRLGEFGYSVGAVFGSCTRPDIKERIHRMALT